MNASIVRLADLLRRPPRYGINAAAVPRALGLPTYIRITDIDDEGRFTPSPKVAVNDRRSMSYALRPGDLVFARTGASVGKSYLYDSSDGELVYAGFLINVTPDASRLNPKYLSLFAHSKAYWDWVARMSARSGQPGINGREYGQLPIPLPDIQTQTRIAEVVGDLDELIVSLERLITKKQAIKEGMMQGLLTGRTRLPAFDGEWNDVSLGSIATVTMGQSPPGATYNSDGHGTSLVQGNADIRDRVTFDRVWTTAPTKLCKRGDVILTVRAPVGYTAIASRASCLGRGVCALSTKSDNRFLFHALVYVEPSWALYEQGSTFTAVNSNEVRSFTLRWPADADERSAIARVLDDAEDELRILELRLGKARAIKQGMMQELLTGRTRLPVQEAVA